MSILLKCDQIWINKYIGDELMLSRLQLERYKVEKATLRCIRNTCYESTVRNFNLHNPCDDRTQAAVVVLLIYFSESAAETQKKILFYIRAIIITEQIFL